MENLPPLRTEHLFRPLLAELLALLEGLSTEDWQRPTRAGAWRVRDVAAHLLGTNIRRLSLQRDGHFGPPPAKPIAGYGDLVDYLNGLNASWIEAYRRVSPRLILELLGQIGPEACSLFEGLDPEGEAPFSVAWAGEERSTNAFDVAREYTEQWHHQQQIREAVGAPLLDAPSWVEPALATFVRGLPYAYRDAVAVPGSRVVLEVTGSAPVAWTLERQVANWKLGFGPEEPHTTRLRTTSEVAWRLFSKMISRQEALAAVDIQGDPALAEPLLHFVGFMV